MEPSQPETTPLITRLDVEPSDDVTVDCKCELTPQTRWQIALFATLAIAVASAALYGVYWLALWAGWVN